MSRQIMTSLICVSVLAPLAVSAQAGFQPIGAQAQVARMQRGVNIIRYAYPEGAGTITVDVSLVPGVCLEIRESGRPFDPRRVPAPDWDEHVKQGRKDGLGVYLARSLVDEFDYRREGGENVVTLTQCLPAAPRG